MRPFSVSSSGRLAWVVPAVALALGVFAFRALLLRALELPTATGFESWMFRPSRQPTLLVLAVAGWLLYRRRGSLRAIAAERSVVATVLFATLGVAFFTWALLTRTVDLFLPSLSANLLAFAAAARGWRGCRAALLPALVILLGMRIPAPLEAEVVWQLQLGSASGAAWLLGAIGRDVTRFGVILRSQETNFHVIDACSGLAGIEILLLIAVIVRELFADSGHRQWWVVAFAPLLAIGLNMVRIAAVALSANPDALVGADGGHALQGVAVLAAGSAILYALALAMARGPGAAGDRIGRPGPDSGVPWRPTIVWLALLAVLSLVVPPFEIPAAALALSPIEFPERRARWTSTPLEMSPAFLGPLPEGQSLYRRYQEPDSRGAVELFVGLEVGRFSSSSRLLSSKFRQPGPDWEIARTRDVELWTLGREAVMSAAKRPLEEERALIYTWPLRDRGFFTECWRSLLALDSSPWRREGRRGVVQLVTFTPFDGSLANDRAKQQLDRFIKDFRADLEAL